MKVIGQYQIILNFENDIFELRSLEVTIAGKPKPFSFIHGSNLSKSKAIRALALCLIEYVIWWSEPKGKFCFTGNAKDSPPRTLMTGITGRGGVFKGKFKGKLLEVISPIFEHDQLKNKHPGKRPPMITIDANILQGSSISFFVGTNHITENSALIKLAKKIVEKGKWKKYRSKFLKLAQQKGTDKKIFTRIENGPQPLPSLISYTPFDRIDPSHQIFAETFGGIKFKNASDFSTLKRTWPVLSHELKVAQALQEHRLICLEGPLVSGKTSLALSIGLDMQNVFYCEAESLQNPFTWVPKFEQLLELNNPDTLVIVDNCHLNDNAFGTLAKIWKESPTITRVILLYRPTMRMTEVISESRLGEGNFHLVYPSLNDLFEVYKFWHPDKKPFMIGIDRCLIKDYSNFDKSQDTANREISRFRSELRALSFMAKDSLLDVEVDSTAGKYLHSQYCCRPRTGPDILVFAALSANLWEVVTEPETKELLKDAFRSGLTFEISGSIQLDPVFAYLLLAIHQKEYWSVHQSPNAKPLAPECCIERRMAKSELCITGWGAGVLAKRSPLPVVAKIVYGCIGNEFIYSSYRKVFCRKAVHP